MFKILFNFLYFKNKDKRSSGIVGTRHSNGDNLVDQIVRKDKCEGLEVYCTTSFVLVYVKD